MRDISLYIHWPFCLSKCPYCDFNSHVRASIDHTLYEQALLRELSYFVTYLKAHQEGPLRLKSIFFGGGTPSLMPPQTVARLIESACAQLEPIADIEITLEGNPTSIEKENYRAFRDAGVNRVSIGVQSLHEKHLRFLGRMHKASEALEAVSMATNLFKRVSFDLIYALPEQSLQEWRSDLEHITDLRCDHLSLYQLTIEEGTPFYQRHKRGEFIMPDDDLATDFYELTQSVLKERGFCGYEISNYAKPGQESQHNLTYWTYGDYIGIGPGAHGRLTLGLQKKRLLTEMIRAPEAWLKSVLENGHGLRTQSEVAPEEQIIEHLLMNFRLKEGVSKEAFLKRHSGLPLKSVLDPQSLDILTREGFMEETPQALKLTQKGLLVMDRVLRDLLLDQEALKELVG